MDADQTVACEEWEEHVDVLPFVRPNDNQNTGDLGKVPSAKRAGVSFTGKSPVLLVPVRVLFPFALGHRVVG